MTEKGRICWIVGGKNAVGCFTVRHLHSDTDTAENNKKYLDGFALVCYAITYGLQ